MFTGKLSISILANTVVLILELMIAYYNFYLKKFCMKLSFLSVTNTEYMNLVDQNNSLQYIKRKNIIHFSFRSFFTSLIITNILRFIFRTFTH